MQPFKNLVFFHKTRALKVIEKFPYKEIIFRDQKTKHFYFFSLQHTWLSKKFLSRSCFENAGQMSQKDFGKISRSTSIFGNKFYLKQRGHGTFQSLYVYVHCIK